MVSFRANATMCTERDGLASWIDSNTTNRQLSPTPGSCSQESHAKTKKLDKHVTPPKPTHKLVPVTAEGFLQEIKVFEGIVPHMYRDSKGYVTVGIGFLIENTTSTQMDDVALTMPFVNSSTHKPATAEEIKAEFTAVKTQHAYKTKLVLDDAYINKRFDQLVKSFWNQLRDEFGPDFISKYPMPVQYALLDMIFNLGRGGDIIKNHKVVKKTGIHQYGQLRKALDKGDWKKAGDSSHRNGIGDHRNDRIKEWFHAGDSAASLTPLYLS